MGLGSVSPGLLGPPGVLRPTWPFDLNGESTQADGLIVWMPCVPHPLTAPFDMVRPRTRSESTSGSSGTFSWRHDPLFGQVLRTGDHATESIRIPAHERLDGTDDGSGTLALSLSAWIYDEGDGTTRYSLSRFVDVGGERIFFVQRTTDTTGNFRIYNQIGTTYDCSGTWAVGRWFHLCVTASNLDNNDIRQFYYFNGVQVGSAVGFSPGSRIRENSTVPLDIGRQGTSGGTKAQRICDIRLYDRVLTAGEVKRLHGAATRWDLYQPGGATAYFFGPLLTKVTAPTTVTFPTGAGDVVPARLLDWTGTSEVWGYACGPELVWCDSEKVYQSRLVDYVGATEVWAYASQCCEYPIELTIEFVEQDTFPPHGISKHLRARVRNVIDCPNLCGDDVLLEYAEGPRQWSGSDGTLLYRVTVNDPPSLHLHVECVAVSPVQVLFDSGISIDCIYPLHASPPASFFGADCCLCPTGSIYVSIEGFCTDRIKLSRLVDYVGTVEVWGYSECCEPACNHDQGCCSLYDSCNLAVVFEALDSCACLAGEEFTLAPIAPIGSTSRWRGTKVLANCLSAIATVTVSCTPQAGTPPCSDWDILVSFSFVSGCSCTSLSASIADVCDCVPLLLEFTGMTNTCTGIICPCASMSVRATVILGT